MKAHEVVNKCLAEKMKIATFVAFISKHINIYIIYICLFWEITGSCPSFVLISLSFVYILPF